MRRNLLRVGLAIAVTLIVLEAILQMASLVVRQSRSAGRDSAESERSITILCVGDSHTYGAGVPRSHSYPAQLQQQLNQQDLERGVSVVNLGVPGMNSAMVANRLEGQIAQFQPRLVIVWAGLNDKWNVSETEFSERADRSRCCTVSCSTQSSIDWPRSIGWPPRSPSTHLARKSGRTAEILVGLSGTTLS